MRVFPEFLVLTLICAGLGPWSLAGEERGQLMRVYGVGVLGNCCTHGAGICAMFKSRPDTRVIAAYEQEPRRAKELQETLGAPLAASYEAVISSPSVDFVAITCDPCDKAEMVERAAKSGKHIFLNKPFCDSLDNARRIEKAVKENHVWLVHDIPMVRSVPVFARLLEEVHAGKHGQVLGYHHLFGMNFAMNFDLKSIWPERLDPASKSGGGEMTNMGCYAIDYAVALFGQPRSVQAKWRKTWDVYLAAGVENFGQIILDYGDFYAFLEVGKQQLEGESHHSNSLTINFEHQVLHIDPSAQLVTRNHVAQDYAAFASGALAMGSVEQLIQAIEEDITPSSGVESGVQSTEVLMAAYQSILEGAPVALPLAEGANPLVVHRSR